MSIHRFAPCAALLLGSVLTATSPARATTAQDQAAAEALFNDAKKFFDARDFEHACPKFAESQRLDPTAGTALSLGRCYEQQGRLASAWGAYKEAQMIARNAGDSARDSAAARFSDALTPQLAKLAVVVPPAARVTGVEVRRDGSLVGEGQWGSAIPIDRGQHTIEVTAPGYKPWSTIVRVETNGSAASVEVPPLEKGTGTPEAIAPGSTWSTQRTVGAAVGGVGVVGLVIGSILGGVTLAKASALKGGHCNTDLTACDATGLSLRQDAKTLANVSTGALVAGGVVLATGIVVIATGSTATSSTKTGTPVGIGLMAGAGLTGVAVSGGW